MSGVLNALSFNNALIASIVCRADETLTWRPVEGIDAKTKFYLSFPEVLSGTETQLLVQEQSHGGDGRGRVASRMAECGSAERRDQSMTSLETAAAKVGLL